MYVIFNATKIKRCLPTTNDVSDLVTYLFPRVVSEMQRRTTCVSAISNQQWSVTDAGNASISVSFCIYYSITDYVLSTMYSDRV